MEEEKEEIRPNMYRAPEVGEVEYLVERTPEEIAGDLLVSNTADEEDEEDDHSGSDTEQEGDEGSSHADSKGGSGQSGGKGGTGTSSAASVGNPSYWRGGFVPLGDEELQAMKLAGGDGALEEYLVKRYACGGWITDGRLLLTRCSGRNGSGRRGMGAVPHVHEHRPLRYAQREDRYGGLRFHTMAAVVRYSRGSGLDGGCLEVMDCNTMIAVQHHSCESRARP